MLSYQLISNAGGSLGQPVSPISVAQSPLLFRRARALDTTTAFSFHDRNDYGYWKENRHRHQCRYRNDDYISNDMCVVAGEGHIVLRKRNHRPDEFQQVTVRNLRVLLAQYGGEAAVSGRMELSGISRIAS
jgi:hypothetical protein